MLLKGTPLESFESSIVTYVESGSEFFVLYIALFGFKLQNEAVMLCNR